MKWSGLTTAPQSPSEQHQQFKTDKPKAYAAKLNAAAERSRKRRALSKKKKQKQKQKQKQKTACVP
jgi:hypothetical protein